MSKGLYDALFYFRTWFDKETKFMARGVSSVSTNWNLFCWNPYKQGFGVAGPWASIRGCLPVVGQLFIIQRYAGSCPVALYPLTCQDSTNFRDLPEMMIFIDVSGENPGSWLSYGKKLVHIEYDLFEAIPGLLLRCFTHRRGHLKKKWKFLFR